MSTKSENDWQYFMRDRTYAVDGITQQACRFGSKDSTYFRGITLEDTVGAVGAQQQQGEAWTFSTGPERIPATSKLLQYLNADSAEAVYARCAHQDSIVKKLIE